MESNAKMLETGEYSDLTIKCDGREYKVHKLILCSQSRVIKAECDLDMKEKRTGVISHAVFDAETMYRMLQFAYTKTYDVAASPGRDPTQVLSASATAPANSHGHNAVGNEGPEHGGVESPDDSSFSAELISHVHVYGIADYYALEELKNHAESRFAAVAANDWPNSAADELADVAEEVCRVTTSGETTGLRAALHSIIADHLNVLVNNAHFKTKIAALAEGQTFAAEMWSRAAYQSEKHQNDRHEILEQQLADKEEELETLNTVHGNLLVALGNVPSTCRNPSCHKNIPHMTQEQMGVKWQIRCTSCWCRLVTP